MAMRLYPSPPLRSTACAVALLSYACIHRAPFRRIGTVVASSTEMAAQLTPSPAASNDNAAAVVTALHRFAVKGLERDALDQVALETGGSFPYDRRWALHFAGGAGAKGFSPATPEWLHKSAFLCAFTATELMASFESRFDLSLIHI